MSANKRKKLGRLILKINGRNNMTQKERAIHRIDKIKERIDKCEPMSVILLGTSEFIEDSYNDREIDLNTFNELRHRLKTTTNSFPLNCSCMDKK